MTSEQGTRTGEGTADYAYSLPYPESRCPDVDIEKNVPERPIGSALERKSTRANNSSRFNPITPIISSLSTEVYDPGPPPDGGIRAWTQAVMAHFVIFTTWGYINSFGVFQTYYVTTLGRSPSEISWVGKRQFLYLHPSSEGGNEYLNISPSTI
jgi:hypothetical protein